jgi:hypothetical protein
MRIKPLSHAGDGATESYWWWLCRGNLTVMWYRFWVILATALLRQLGHNVMLMSSHDGDDAVKTTWPQHIIDAESWQRHSLVFINRINVAEKKRGWVADIDRGVKLLCADALSPPCSGAESPRGRADLAPKVADVEVPVSQQHKCWSGTFWEGDCGLARVLARRLPLFLFCPAIAQSKPSVHEKKEHRGVMNLID